MTDTPSENENRHEAAPHADLIRKWEAMTDKQRLETAEADIFHSILTEGLSKLREVLDALPPRMMRDEVPEGFNRNTDPGRNGNNFILVAMVRIATI